MEYYTVTASNSSGCSVTSVATIIGASPIPGIQLSAVSIDPTCGGSNGSIDLTVTGFTGTLNYSWSANGQTAFATTQDISNVAANMYTCINY